MITSFDELVASVKSRPKKIIAVAMAEEEEALQAISNARKEGLADAILVGQKKKIISIAERCQIDLSDFDMVNAESEVQSVVRCIQMVRENFADTIMKGNCATATLLKGVLDKEHGIRTGKVLSHVAVLQVERYHKLLFMSDGGMNIAPDAEIKIAIIDNAVKTARSFGIRKPKVAMIAAIEKVNYQSMPCTADAAIISKMAERGQIRNCLVDGPLALDNAVSKKACEIKNIKSPIDGDADILLMPNIEAGNVFYKAVSYFGTCKTAGMVVGAKTPIIVASRADNDETKFYSIALAMQAIDS